MSETAPKPSLLREFDLAYWQMREALGYPIPDRIDRRWPRKLGGNGGHNPFQCGLCTARRLYPATNLSCDVLFNRRRMTDDDRREFEERITEALIAPVPPSK